MAATKTATRGDDGKFHCGCGESFTSAGWFARHTLKCDGKPVQRRGRIDRLAARSGKHVPVPARRRPGKPTAIDAEALHSATATRGYRGRAIDDGAAPPKLNAIALVRPQPARTAAEAQGAIAAAATNAAIDLTIVGLQARRQQLDTAIAALEALRA